ncbi:MAG: hypothetical protein ABH879_02515 [archaeon]
MRYLIAIALVAAMLTVAGCGATGQAKGGKPGAEPIQCNDKIDNDGDGFCDWAGQKKCTDGSQVGDPDCADKDDNSEAPDCVPEDEVCDEADNDCDGEIDEGFAIECSTPSECGTGGYMNPVCGDDGNLYMDWVVYRCSDAGTCLSSCSSESTNDLYRPCSNGCLDGQCLPGDNETNST